MEPALPTLLVDAGQIAALVWIAGRFLTSFDLLTSELRQLRAELRKVKAAVERIEV
jgi:hypothetical protein